MDRLRKVNHGETLSGDIAEPLANKTQIWEIKVLACVANVIQDLGRKIQDVERLVRISVYKCRVVLRIYIVSVESLSRVTLSLAAARI